jgi:hypothetical protein
MSKLWTFILFSFYFRSIWNTKVKKKKKKEKPSSFFTFLQALHLNPMIRWVQGRRGYYSPSSENPQIPSPARARALNFLGEEKISPWREPRPRMAGLGGGWGGGYDDDDDWGLSAEQLDQLERDAYRKLAERKASSSAASTATSPLPSAAYSPVKNSHHHPASRVSQESCFGKVESLSPSRLSQPNASGNAVNNSQGNMSKVSVHLFLHSTGVIAAKFQYHQVQFSPMKSLISCYCIILWSIYLTPLFLSQKLVDAVHKIPKASWNGKERFSLIFYLTNLQDFSMAYQSSTCSAFMLSKKNATL